MSLTSFSLNFYIPSLFFVDGIKAIYVNPGCLKACQTNLSSVINIIYTISFIFYHFISCTNLLILLKQKKT